MMDSPALDAIRKRPYYQPRHRNKKKLNHVSTRFRKDGKTLQPQRITQKRLTNKSGFCFKGAVLTSSLMRDPGQGVPKPKKGSTDFDLMCLLKAAKRKDVSDESPSSYEADDPPNLILHNSEENTIPTKRQTKSFKLQSYKKDLESNSRSSSQNNLGLHEFDNVTAIEKVPVTKHSDSDTLWQESSPYKSVPKDSGINANYSSADNLLRNKNRPCLSAYHKYAVGIVNALVSEKKKQFPSQSLCSDIQKDLIHTYNETHKTTDVQDVPFISKREVGRTFKPDNFIIPKRIVEAEHPIVTKGVTTFKPDIQVSSCDKEETYFKDKCVQAWVKAIPERIFSEINKDCGKNRQQLAQSRVDHMPMEKEFFKIIPKGSSSFKPTNLSPFNIVGSLPTWDIDDIKSPIFSPHMQTQKVNKPVGLGENLRTDKRMKVAEFGSRLLPWNGSKQKEHYLADCNFPLGKNELTGFTHRPQKFWMPFLKESGKNCSSGRKTVLESPSCLSPSCTVDPPLENHNWFTQVDFGNETKRSHTRYSNDKPSLWRRFPELLKREKEDPNDDEVKCTDKIHTPPKTFSYTKFSPIKKCSRLNHCRQ